MIGEERDGIRTQEIVGVEEQHGPRPRRHLLPPDGAGPAHSGVRCDQHGRTGIVADGGMCHRERLSVGAAIVDDDQDHRRVRLRQRGRDRVGDKLALCRAPG